MGTKRIGLARVEALMENLKREISFGAGTKLTGVQRPTESVTADDSLLATESGTLYVFADAAATLTLPDSGAGDIIGCTFEFVSMFQGTGQKVVCADTGNEKIVGAIVASDADDDNATKAWGAEVADNFSSVNITSVALGRPGTKWKLTCVAADRWLVEGVALQSGGSEATLFATT